MCMYICIYLLTTGLLTADHVTAVDTVTVSTGGRHVSVVVGVNSQSQVIARWLALPLSLVRHQFAIHNCVQVAQRRVKGHRFQARGPWVELG